VYVLKKLSEVLCEQTSDSSAFLNVTQLNSIFHISVRRPCLGFHNMLIIVLLFKCTESLAELEGFRLFYLCVRIMYTSVLFYNGSVAVSSHTVKSYLLDFP
jgi:hypothetical protein